LPVAIGIAACGSSVEIPRFQSTGTEVLVIRRAREDPRVFVDDLRNPSRDVPGVHDRSDVFDVELVYYDAAPEGLDIALGEAAPGADALPGSAASVRTSRFEAGRFGPWNAHETLQALAAGVRIERNDERCLLSDAPVCVEPAPFTPDPPSGPACPVCGMQPCSGGRRSPIGCVPFSCPPGWPEGEGVYVVQGGAGVGTKEAPFGDIATALTTTSAVIFVGEGDFDLPATIGPGRSVIGLCPTRTKLRAPEPATVRGSLAGVTVGSPSAPAEILLRGGMLADLELTGELGVATGSVVRTKVVLAGAEILADGLTAVELDVVGSGALIVSGGVRVADSSLPAIVVQRGDLSLDRSAVQGGRTCGAFGEFGVVVGRTGTAVLVDVEIVGDGGLCAQGAATLSRVIAEVRRNALVVDDRVVVRDLAMESSGGCADACRAVVVEGGSLQLTRAIVDYPAGHGVVVSQGRAALEDVVIRAGGVGLWLMSESAQLTRVDVQTARGNGVLACNTSAPITLAATDLRVAGPLVDTLDHVTCASDAVIAGDGNVAVSIDGFSIDGPGVGARVNSTNVTLRNGVIAGCDTGLVYRQGNTIDNVTFRNNGTNYELIQ
jgi:hypothetical protein